MTRMAKFWQSTNFFGRIVARLKANAVDFTGM